MMKRALLFTAVFASVLVAADVRGKWKGNGETPYGKFERTFEFKVDGSKLTGESASVRFGKSPIEDGKIDGDNLSFTIAVSYQGNEAKVNYKGKVSGDEIKFTVEVPGVDEPIVYTAKRVS